VNNTLLDFYRGTQPDVKGRRIADIWGWDHTKLESVHDYIQWLFPSAKPSAYNPNAPLLDDETIAVFQSEQILQENLLQSLDLMLRFYGLELQGDDFPVIAKADNYAFRKANWQDAPAGQINHNLLRLTRILEALNVLGLQSYSRALCRCLNAIQREEPTKIPQKTAQFWCQAAGI
jgi:hypothetical protein